MWVISVVFGWIEYEIGITEILGRNRVRNNISEKTGIGGISSENEWELNEISEIPWGETKITWGVYFKEENSGQRGNFGEDEWLTGVFQ